MILGLLYVGSAFVSLFYGTGGWIHAGIAVLHILLGLLFFAGTITRIAGYTADRVWYFRASRTAADILFILSASMFGFLYFYALNANMDYVQRFMEHSGVLQLAMDTGQERLQVFLTYGPLILSGILAHVLLRLVFRVEFHRHFASGWAVWSLPFLLLSAVAAALSLPNGIFLHGLPLLAWIAVVPLLIGLVKLPFFTAWRYGFAWSMTFLILGNYWLATYSLVSLQTAVLIYAGLYFIFLPAIISVRYLSVSWRWVFAALALAFFDYFRSIGFLGYPWALLSHSQYENVILMQIAELGGVWLLAFLLFMINAALADFLSSITAVRKIKPALRKSAPSIITAVGFLTFALLFGAVRLLQAPDMDYRSDDSVTVALIQQNTDPRQADFNFTFGVLQDLTSSAMEHDPQLVVWGETAFVPNIRRWSDPELPRGAYTNLVSRLLNFQAGLGVALLTGNDDYEIVRDQNGREIGRNHFNAAVLFDAEGNRRETYHKIRLVPFTEYFPMGDVFPAALELLESYGVVFWEPGTERTVFDFEHFSFITPICFEDVFPQEVRKSVKGGADVILNITNDYWSLNPVQAEQHYAAGVFRAVENRRPLLRASVSGKTVYVDSYGRKHAELPMYVRDYLVVDFDPELENQRSSLYTRFGDWFPIFSLLLLLAACLRWVLQTGAAGTESNPVSEE